MSNFITNLLLIKDQNITMEDKLDLINVDGQDTFVFHGTLSYNPKCCPNCGCKKEENNIVKNGFGDPLKVTLLKMSECPTYLRLRKQRFNGMSFVFLDAKTHDFIDIVDGRTQHILKQYFMRYSRKVRKKVKTICIDIYPPYMNMIREMFPNAEIIIDRFHMVQNINRELNKARVKLMNQYKNKKGSTYTILKNFWKVILEDRDKVNSTKTFYSRSFKRYVTRKEVLDYILAIDAEFTASYERVHEIREAIKAKDSVELEKYIDMDTKGLSKGVAKAINTMKKHKEYMLNSVKYEYSNGPLEGFNNKIKLLKRVSYGYSSFSNFRLRILIMSRLFVSEYKNNIKLKENKKKSKQQNAA